MPIWRPLIVHIGVGINLIKHWIACSRLTILLTSMDNTLAGELVHVRPIDPEIASLAASLGTDIRTATRHEKSPTPNQLESRCIPEDEDVDSPTTLKRFAVFFSLAMSIVIAYIPYSFVTASSCLSLLSVYIDVDSVHNR
jgi:hypothetical protein